MQLYDPGTTVVDMGKRRWKLFTEKQLEAQKLPSIQGALHEAIACAHFQAMVWHQAHVPEHQLPPQNMDGEQEISLCPSQPKISCAHHNHCLLYTSPSPRDLSTSRMPSSA